MAAVKAKMQKNRFFFIKPKEGTDTNKFVEKLFSLKNVQEVILTEGDCGYIVKTRFFGKKSDREAERYINRNVSGVDIAVSHCQFRK